jgi:glycosyltransferase involved in cell wall biosynthesis
MKKKLAIVSHEYYPVLCGGTIFCHKMAREFTKLGWEVEVLVPHVGATHLYPDLEMVDGFVVRRFRTLRKSVGDATLLEHLLFFLLGFPQMLHYCVKKRFDVYLPVFAFPAGFMALLLRPFLPHSKVFTFVDAADTPGMDSARKTLVKLLLPIFKFVTRFSDGVIVLDGLEDVAIPYISNKRVVVLPNGAEIPTEIPSTPLLADEPLRFLTIGRLVSRKGFESIIQAAALLKKDNSNFLISIVGYGPLEASLKKLAADLGLERNVSFLGRMEYKELPKLFFSHHCYLFCGDREGSSLAMIEAVAHGMPVIASDHPGNRTFVLNNKNGFLFEFKNIEQLKGSMLQLLSERTLLPIFSKASVEVAKNNSWGEIARKYEYFIQKE